jgi:hypothetical protein
MEATRSHSHVAVRVSARRRTSTGRLALFAVVAASLLWLVAAPSAPALIFVASAGIALLGWGGEPIRASETEIE